MHTKATSPPLAPVAALYHMSTIIGMTSRRINGSICSLNRMRRGGTVEYRTTKPMARRNSRLPPSPLSCPLLFMGPSSYLHMGPSSHLHMGLSSCLHMGPSSLHMGPSSHLDIGPSCITPSHRLHMRPSSHRLTHRAAPVTGLMALGKSHMDTERRCRTLASAPAHNSSIAGRSPPHIRVLQPIEPPLRDVAHGPTPPKPGAPTLDHTVSTPSTDASTCAPQTP